MPNSKQAVWRYISLRHRVNPRPTGTDGGMVSLGPWPFSSSHLRVPRHSASSGAFKEGLRAEQLGGGAAIEQAPASHRGVTR